MDGAAPFTLCGLFPIFQGLLIKSSLSDLLFISLIFSLTYPQNLSEYVGTPAIWRVVCLKISAPYEVIGISVKIGSAAVYNTELRFSGFGNCRKGDFSL